jgi:hypothetical protein
MYHISFNITVQSYKKKKTSNYLESQNVSI